MVRLSNGERFPLFVVCRGEDVLAGRATLASLLASGLTVKQVNSISLYVTGRQDGDTPAPTAEQLVGVS